MTQITERRRIRLEIERAKIVKQLEAGAGGFDLDEARRELKRIERVLILNGELLD